MLDLILAISHHLLVFGLFGVLFAELIAVRRGMDQAAVARVAAFDLWYGVLAAAIIVVGFTRAIYAAKGWAYYSHNGFFWAKIGVFAMIGLLSAPPTLAYSGLKRTGAAPTDAQVSTVRHYLYLEVILFALLPVFAAAMARGYGEF